MVCQDARRGAFLSLTRAASLSNNLMDPVEDREQSKLMYVCKNCNVDPIYTDQMVVYRNDLREAEEYVFLRSCRLSFRDIPRN